MRSWWSNKTFATYNEKKQGIADQYNGYSLESGKVNGDLTLGENIADNGGLKAAFRVRHLLFIGCFIVIADFALLRTGFEAISEKARQTRT